MVVFGWEVFLLGVKSSRELEWGDDLLGGST